MAEVPEEKTAHPPGDEAEYLELEGDIRRLEAKGPKLATLGDVQRAMADLCRRLRTGAIDYRQGNALTVAYNTLHGMMRDARDNKHKKRLRVLWEAHQRGQGLSVQEEAEDSEAN